ncbi:MAG: Flp pilus assembly complex ATPase component TadA [Ruminococcus sp.]|jgi:type IV pilus assembly protein PilB|uniref:Type II secretion system protein E n=1 Tax=Ruminococcus albus SY3 TaxID=1341156 RepID=A0A011VZ06_RUMAL|nr:GspE/PulE family protein [Ruminococcus albus]EXM38269.1 type II secretion system protein E [Ruminococcus albus SY3]EXM39803.1 type II secretion system protein E [Ruminococcus albus SY3]MBE6868873.1 type II secretion system protein GspE [Ruminococcus albus]MBP5268839.1 Flp pilus assembly complex ATPase component TadA [Ruminococcus sp.]
MRNGPIGQYLVEKNLLSEADLNAVLERQKTEKDKKFGDIVIEMKLVSDIDFAKTLAERMNVEFIDLDNAQLNADVVKLIPEATARKYTVIAVKKIGRRMMVATNDPMNFYVFEDLRVITGCNITAQLATKASINRAIGRMYSEGAAAKVAEEAKQEKEEESVSLDEIDLSSDRVDNAPIVKLATAIVEQSFRQGATDIHIEPFKDHTKIRVRINSDLVPLMEDLDSRLHVSLVTRFKILSGMNIAEKRIPQDGRMSQVIDGTTVDLRVSNLPMVYGEKVVLRILAGDSSVRRIQDLGMTDYNYKRFVSCLKVPQGVVLVTGPTGSGKSTTLYAALGEIAKPNLNVITVEDPVEKKIANINQCQINEKAGMTFAAALRSILRQDPDIIMIGEMRDTETAEIGIRAAITGHLVLSTLHTNDAASTVTRLVDMGVDAYMVATSLIGVVAQRLAKVVCPNCREGYMSTDEDNELMGITESVPVYKPVGCSKCTRGYIGRTAIHEILLATPKMKEIIAAGAKSEQIQELAKEEGCRLLRDNVSELVQQGRTTMDELVRVTYAV